MPFTDYYPRPDAYQANYGQPAGAFPGGGPIDLRGEVLLTQWTDFTPLIYQRSPLTITRGRPNQSATLTPSQASMTLNNRDGRWTIRNPAGAWYGQLVQSSPLRLSVPSSVAGIPAYLRLETDTLSYASTPDSAGLQITSGTLSVRIDCKITDWISNHVLAAKNQAWALWTNGNGTIQFDHWDAGGTQRSHQSTLPLPYYGARIAIRIDYNVAAQKVTFFTAPMMAGS